MRKQFGYISHKYAVITAVTVAAVVLAWGLYPQPASAQRSQPPTATGSSGHLTLSPGDTVRVGLLLPAIQKVRETALIVRDTAGNNLFIAHPDTNPQIDSFFDITYQIDSAGRGGFVMHDMHGNELGIAPSQSGVMIALLVPAVQKVREAASRGTANFQIVNGEGQTAVIDSFFDIDYQI